MSMKRIGSVTLSICLSGSVFALGSSAPTSGGGSGGQAAPSSSSTPSLSPNSRVHAARWERVRSNSRSWTTYTHQQVGNFSSLMNVTPRDAEEFCPGFRNLNDNEVRNFYTYLVSAMAQLESYFDPSLSHAEDFYDGQGRRVVSRGLLQLSIGSVNYYGCGISRSSQLHDAKTNLKCGLRILNHSIGRDHRIAGYYNGRWRGGARYWAVLRRSSLKNKIKGWTRAYCQNVL